MADHTMRLIKRNIGFDASSGVIYVPEAKCEVVYIREPRTYYSQHGIINVTPFLSLYRICREVSVHLYNYLFLAVCA